MVKLIPGKRGSGKTKILIDAINAARTQSKGNIVTIQTGRTLNAQVKPDVRLIDIEDYNVRGCEAMQGFVSGIIASDYDCTHIFIDGILRIIGKDDRADMEKVAAMLEEMHRITGDDTLVTLTFSADDGELTEKIKKFV